MKYKSEYRYNHEFGHARHMWVVIARHLAMHLHIVDLGEEAGADRYSGGIELHWREPPDHMGDQAPDHSPCSILNAPCWHDGSSLQAAERWIPLWLTARYDHDRMFRLLEAEIDRRAKGAP